MNFDAPKRQYTPTGIAKFREAGLMCISPSTAKTIKVAIIAPRDEPSANDFRTPQRFQLRQRLLRRLVTRSGDGYFEDMSELHDFDPQAEFTILERRLPHWSQAGVSHGLGN